MQSPAHAHHKSSTLEPVHTHHTHRKPPPPQRQPSPLRTVNAPHQNPPTQQQQLQSAPSQPSPAHLCDVVLQTLQSYSSSTSSTATQQNAQKVHSEVAQLRKFLDLMSKILTSGQPRMTFEEEHFSDISVLISRCPSTLSRLWEVLSSSRGQQWGPEVAAIRARCSIYSSALQMSLQTVKLVYQWKISSSTPGSSPQPLHSLVAQLTHTLTALKDSVQRRRGLPPSAIQCSPREESAFLYDVEKCLFSAEVIMNITTTTLYDTAVQSPSPIQQHFAAELPGSPAVGAAPEFPPNEPNVTQPLPLRVEKVKGKGAASPVLAPSPLSAEADDDLPEVVVKQQQQQQRQRQEAPTLQQLPPRQDSKPPPKQDLVPPLKPSQDRKKSPIRQSQAGVAYRPDSKAPGAEKPIVFSLDDIDSKKSKPLSHHPSNTKHRGSFHSDHSDQSETDSIFDPEPDFEDSLPAVVYEQLISSLQDEVSHQILAHEFDKAEQSHRKCIEYLTDRERKLGVAFNAELKTSMQETLATIYRGKGEINKAKQLLNQLITSTPGPTEDPSRKPRLYHSLAEIYKEQDRLAEAEKFAKRAYIGREKSLAKDSPELLESVNLLVSIYARQHKHETAEALRQVYRAPSPSARKAAVPEVPPKSTARHEQQRQPSPQPQPPPLSQQPSYQHQKPPPHQQPYQHQQPQQQPPQIESPYTYSAPQFPSQPAPSHSATHLPYPPSPSSIKKPQPRSPPPESHPTSPFSPDTLATASALTSQPAVRWGPDLSFTSHTINAVTKSGETPLISAIGTGDTELVRLILQRGADTEVRCADGMTPLMHAIHQAHQSHTSSLSIVESLLSSNPEIDAMTASWTPLHRAAALSLIPIVKLLLARGADIEARSPKDFVWKSGNPLSRMMNSQTSPNIDLDEYDTISTTSSTGGWTCLLRAASNGDEAIVRVLLDKGADIEARNPSNGTPLTCAAEGKHEAIAELLLQHGADVNAEDDFGWKPLHRCLVHRGGERVAQILLANNASVDSRCTYQKTPLHHAIEKGNESMVMFLLNAGADIEARDIADRTPLHAAIEARLEVMVRALLDQGADADAMDRDRRDALKAAEKALRRSPEIISLLQKHKKDKGKRASGSVSGPSGRKVSGSLRSGVGSNPRAGLSGSTLGGRRGSASTAGGESTTGLSSQGAGMGLGGRQGSISGSSYVSRNSSSGGSSWWSLRSKGGAKKR